MDRDIPSYNHLVTNKIQQKNMQIHYQKLARIRNSRSHKTNGSINPGVKLKTKKYQLEEERKTEIERNNMRLFSKMAKILRRDDPNNRPLPSGSKLNTRLEKEYSRISEENKTMLERLCHLKPTINNKKMLEQRNQELKYLRLIGKHSSHHITQTPSPAPPQNSSSFRNSQQSQRQRAQRVKTENFKVTRMDEFPGEGDFSFHQRPKYITQGPQDMRPVTHDQAKRRPRYSSSQQHGRGRSKGGDWFGSDNEEEGGSKFKDIELFKAVRELKGAIYSFLIVRRYNCYQMLCCAVNEPSEEYLLELSEMEGNSLLETLNYDYNQLIELLEIRNGELRLGEAGRQQWHSVVRKTEPNVAPTFIKSHLSNITELNQEESKLREQRSRPGLRERWDLE